jgi:two-component system response regulator RegX3
MTMTRAGRRPYETIEPATIGHLRLLRANGVGIDLDGRRVFTDGTEIRLAPKEFELLRVLLENAGRIMTRRELLDTIWYPGHADANKTLEVHIGRLRRKLGSPPGPPLIRTARGIGYIFDVAADQLTGRG